MKILITFILLFAIIPQFAHAQDEYAFDFSEIEKKPYSFGGYMEIRPVIFRIDKDAALYKLKFLDRDEGDRLEEYNFTLQLDGSYEKGIAKLYTKINNDAVYDTNMWSGETTIFEGFLSLKPSLSLSMDTGKKTLKWGKGYAWNPVAFVDREKNPDDPALALEGFIVASADYIKSFQGPLKTISLTPVLIPVYEGVNDEFGEINNLNFAGKIYLLVYDTDLDFIIMTGGSKTSRYGFDFSRNLTSNFEIHGEFAFINDFTKRFIDSNGQLFEKRFDAKSYLFGIRYLTKLETTYILEYYHNGTGFSSKEMRDYFSFISKAFDTFIVSGNDSLLKKASNLTKGNYGRINPMRDYLYLRISQKEPYDILYSTLAVSGIYNLNDKSFSLSPEMLYNPITNLELRLKVGIITGSKDSEYGEKQNDYRAELRVRYYF